ncbi:hypothetical protein LEP1GSC127_0490 [Leptospira kirschneri str. 200801925]|nr:hypothetical protein LEP1GSC127_0490 [Leptospira kirschneri str. 200801925]
MEFLFVNEENKDLDSNFFPFCGFRIVRAFFGISDSSFLDLTLFF